MYVGGITIKTQVVSTTDSSEQHSATRYGIWNINRVEMLASSPQMTLDSLTLEIRESKKYGQNQFDFYILSSDVKDEYYPHRYIASLPLKKGTRARNPCNYTRY